MVKFDGNLRILEEHSDQHQKSVRSLHRRYVSQF